LQGIDVPDSFGHLQLGDVVIRQPNSPDLSFLLQIEQRLPIGFDWCAVLRGLVHLIEIDTIHLQPAQRALNLAP
jgi:hypothetical protein